MEYDNNLQILVQTDLAKFLDYIKNSNLSNIFVITENDTSYTDNGIHNEKTSEQNYIYIYTIFISNFSYYINM